MATVTVPERDTNVLTTLLAHCNKKTNVESEVH